MIEVPPATSDPFYRQELLGHIQTALNAHPRSAQSQIGPSEIGGCPTKVAWKLAYGGDSDRDGGWAAGRGTVLHAWLDQAVFGPGPSLMPDGTQRWFSDLKLDPVSPHVNGGTLDLYDKLHQCVLDFKFPGDWSMGEVRTGKGNPGYYTQINTYGLGLERMGYAVSKVALLMIPSGNDDLHGTARGAILKVWPYDRQVALDALETIAATKRLLDQYGPQAAMEMLPKRSDFCSGCSAFVANADRRAVCPGVTGRAVKNKNDPFA